MHRHGNPTSRRLAHFFLLDAKKPGYRRACEIDVEDADGVDPETESVRHQPIGTKDEAVAAGWLGEGRIIGITAGASTPNNKVGETIARICAQAGLARELHAETG